MFVFFSAKLVCVRRCRNEIRLVDFSSDYPKRNPQEIRNCLTDVMRFFISHFLTHLAGLAGRYLYVCVIDKNLLRISSIQQTFVDLLLERDVDARTHGTRRKTYGKKNILVPKITFHTELRCITNTPVSPCKSALKFRFA